MAIEDDWHVFVGCALALESWYWAGLSTLLQPRVGTVSSLADFVFDICLSKLRHCWSGDFTSLSNLGCT